jgi:uncharacterized protein (DUF2267 family)
MSPRKHDPFAHSVQSASAWLADVAKMLDTEDRHLAYRAIRAWLHTLRDRLTVDGAAQFGAQLPELLRGLYYDGWDPSRVPVKYGPDEYVFRFAQEARIPPDEVQAVATAVARAFRDHLSPGHLDSALGQLPPRLRSLMLWREPEASVATSDVQTPPATPGTSVEESLEPRIERLEAQMASVREALRVLAHGLEAMPGGEPDELRGSHAARQAYEILLAGP